MKEVRIGIIGLGNMGTSHAKYLNEGVVNGAKLTAVCDNDPAALKLLTDKLPGVVGFDNGLKMIKSGKVDAIIVATPHYDHPVFAMAGFANGIHVIVEKPVAVTAKAAQECNEAYEKVRSKGIKYGAMFQQRTNPCWKKVKEIMASGGIGEMTRVTWLVTAWFRTQTYYNSGGWRATWGGEGGGVLMNQSPHNLDLFQWCFGMPKLVQGHLGIGKYHKIEVEDDVTAYLEYANGATGLFVTSTGETPGTNRLEVIGENGRMVVTNSNRIDITYHAEKQSDFCKTCPKMWATPDLMETTITFGKLEAPHSKVTQAFVDAILKGTPLIAEGTEGINGLELGNAMTMSHFLKKPVPCPTDRNGFDKMLKGLIKNSTFKKGPIKKIVENNMRASF